MLRNDFFGPVTLQRTDNESNVASNKARFISGMLYALSGDTFTIETKIIGTVVFCRDSGRCVAADNSNSFDYVLSSSDKEQLDALTEVAKQNLLA
jgi:hypothetical protein